MKKLVNFILSFFIICSVNATELGSEKNVRGSGNIVSKLRKVEAFNELDISGIFKIYLTQGDTEPIRIEIDDNLHQYVLTKVENGILKIKIMDGINFKNISTCNMYITIKDITEINVGGLCEIFGENVIKSDRLKINIKGAASAKMNLNCKSLEIISSGIGDCMLSGKVAIMNITSSGISDFDAKELVAQKVNIVKSGMGDVKVNAVSEINIHFSGLGDILYYGDPKVEIIKKSGLGSIVKK